MARSMFAMRSALASPPFGNSKATATQQAGGLLHLVHQLFVIVINGGLDNLGLLLGGETSVSSLNLGSFGLHLVSTASTSAAMVSFSVSFMISSFSDMRLLLGPLGHHRPIRGARRALFAL